MPNIDPAEKSGFLKIFGEFVRALGAMWASPPTNTPEEYTILWRGIKSP